MTLREKICNAGVDTLREYMCLEIGGGSPPIGGDIIIPDGIWIKEEPSLELTDITDNIELDTINESILIEEDGIIIEIVEDEGDSIHGIS